MQRKYVMDLLKDTGVLGGKPHETPVNPSVKPISGLREAFEDPKRFWRLVGKLNRVTITQLDIAFTVNHFMETPTTT